jgi:hypothetical protein
LKTGAGVYSRLRNAVYAGALAALAGLGATSARASVILPDEYYGGLNTYNSSDVIGPASVFDITDAVIERVSATEISITIDTNFAGVPGTPAADGTGYGVLFLTPGLDAWNPTGTGPHYPTDQYVDGEWMYAATIPQVPGTSSGAGGLYLTSGGTIVMSNVYGDPITYPYAGNPGYYFRQGQAVQFTPGNGQNPLGGTSEFWTVGNGSVTFDIVDNNLLGNDFALAWAMTCANDVIQGEVSLPADPVPEPPTWSVLLGGMFIAGGIAWRRRRGSRNLA